MWHINELAHSLKQHFNWNKARLNCLSNILAGLYITRTVNLVEIANSFGGDAQDASNYKRLQRFFRWIPEQPNYKKECANAILDVLGLKGKKLELSIDRTNWKLGSSDINVLVVGVWFEGVSIPIYWESLGKTGNTNTTERISAIESIVNAVGKKYIKHITADREFIGKVWFDYLMKEKIPFYIRIKANTKVYCPDSDSEMHAKELFSDLNNEEGKALKGKYRIWGLELQLAARRNEVGELLIVVTNEDVEQALSNYRRRWGIESLFGCLKTRGFNFEDTHMTFPERIDGLVFVLTLAMAWVMRTSSAHSNTMPLKFAKHGRLRKSFFRRGLDILRRCLINAGQKLHKLLDLIRLLLPRPPPQKDLSAVQ